MTLDLHNPAVLYAIFWIVSSAVSALPEPKTTSSSFYVWFHNFAQLVVANWSKLKSPQPPAPPAPPAQQKQP